MNVFRITVFLFTIGSLVACTAQTTGDKIVAGYDGVIPVNLGGNWERDYSRGQTVNQVVDRVFRQLQRYRSDPAMSNNPYGANEPSLSQRDMSHIIAIARLADNITSVDVLTISQSDNELSVERKGDFSLFCEFYDGVATGPETEYGSEVCGWDGDQFVSRLILPDGVRITHRFTVADDAEQLLVSTTVSSRQANVPITLNRFYKKFDKPESDFNCVDTLSMKRVCSTSEVTP
jgi:hypothetical protein